MRRDLCDRRTFLALGTVSAAAASLADTLALGSETAAPAPAVDVLAYLGHWPFRATADNSPAAVTAAMRRQGVAEIWVSTFEGLLHKDVSGANARLAAACQHTADMLRPIGVVNPALPDWEEDVRRCHEAFGMKGLRLHPGYHGYELTDPRFGRLLELAAARRMAVQLVAAIDDSATPARWAAPRVDLNPLAAVVAGVPELRLTLHGWQGAVDAEGLTSLAGAAHVYFDAVGVSVAGVAQAASVPADRWVAGSCSPLEPLENLAMAVAELNLSEAAARAAAFETARGLMDWAEDG